MLASITPLGERGRNGHWCGHGRRLRVGATAAGRGARRGARGARAAARAGVPPAPAGAWSCWPRRSLAAIALDLRRRAVPGPHRQVNERWLDEYRGWVYGLGFGAQLGLGVTTVVSSAATYVALLAAFLGAERRRAAR